MGSIILLAFGACLFPTLLACVAIIISRPEPRWLLIAFYSGGLVTSVSTGIVSENATARLDGLRSSLSVMAIIALIALPFSRRIPTEQPASIADT